jgi:hypothetical protein
VPSHSEKQRKFMGAELGRLRSGDKTKTGMSESQLHDFASKPVVKSKYAPLLNNINSFISHIQSESASPKMKDAYEKYKSSGKRVGKPLLSKDITREDNKLSLKIKSLLDLIGG